MWATLLGRATVGADENFFDLGGTSLLLIEMHAKLAAQFASTPSLVDMFAFPTSRILAERLFAGQQTSGKTVLRRFAGNASAPRCWRDVQR